ncbi:MAG: LLM class flavin-dependent oxidoreductase [Sulfobacillus sp.]
MRFGITSAMACPNGRTESGLFQQTLHQIEWAEQAGYDTYALVEHHGFPMFSISANPLAVFAAAAQRTERIRFRSNISVIPLHGPLQLAGELAVVDHLTNGRLEVGVGRGHAWVYNMTDVKMEDSKGRYYESLDIIKQAWTGEKFSYHGHHFSFDNVQVVPRPQQNPHPPLFTGGTSAATYQWAAEQGLGLAVAQLIGGLEETVAEYQRVSRERGFTPRLSTDKIIYITDDIEKARPQVEPFLREYLQGNAIPVASLPAKEKLREKGYGFYASGYLEGLATLSWTELVERDLIWIGSASYITDRIGEFMSKIPIDTLQIMPDFGGMRLPQSLEIMEQFAAGVVPNFK